MTDYNPINWAPYIKQSDALSLVKLSHPWRADQLEAEIWELPLGQGVIQDFTAYKCVEFGIWGRGQGIVVNNAKIADCQIGSQFPGEHNIVQDSVYIGETDNFGTSGEYWVDSDQGRARFYRWDPHHRILGYRHYDNGGPDVVRNSAFYNYIDYKFLFNNNIRKAGAIGIMPGQTVLPSEHRYMNLKFVNTLNHVYFEGPDYDSEQSFAGAAIHDVDGSLTGVCGSEITYNSPILQTSNCVYYPLWNASVCPPGGNPHRYFRVEDHSGWSFTSTQYDRAYSYFYRVPDLVPHRIAPYFYGGYGGSGDRRYSTANLMVNTAYVMVWGANSETPASFKVGFEDGIDGEWVRFGTPFPAGTTFTTDDSRTPVTSFSAMNATTYFYDTTTGLLWLDLHANNVQYYKTYNITVSGASVYTTVTATCPGGCTSPYTPNKSVLSQMPLPTSNSPHNVCEISGNMLGGDISYTENPASQLIFFTDAMATNWTCDDYVDNTVAYGGSGASLRHNMTTSSRALVISRLWQDRNRVISVAPYTHLTFKIKKEISSLGRAIPKMSLQIYSVDLNWNLLKGGQYVSVDSPFINPTFPIDDRDMWHTIYVPLDALGIKTYSNVVTIVITNTDWDWQQNFFFWIDDVRLTTFTGALTANPSERLDTDNVDTSFNYATAPRPSPIPTECPSVCPVTSSGGNALSALASASTPYSGNSSSDSLPGWVVPVIAVMGACIVALIVIVIVLKVNQSKRLVSEYA